MANRENMQQPERRQQEGQQPRQDPSPIRKQKPPMVAIIGAAIALVAIALLCIFVIPRACSGGTGTDGGADDITVTSNGDSLLTDEQAIERARKRYAGTWTLSAVSWQGEGEDGSSIPQTVTINLDGSCSLQQGDTEYAGQWDVDGASLYVRVHNGGDEFTRVMSIDDSSLSVNVGNGTGSYVRTAEQSDGQQQ